MPRQPLRTLWALPALIAMPLAAVPLVMAQTAPLEPGGGSPAPQPAPPSPLPSFPAAPSPSPLQPGPDQRQVQAPKRFDHTLDDLLRDGVVSPRDVRTHEGLFPRSNDVRERPAPSSPAAAGRPAARPAPASAAAKSSPARVRVAGSEGSQDATRVADVAQKITVRIEGAGSSGSGVIVSRDGNNFYTVLTAWHSIGSTQPSEELIVITADKIRRRAITWKRIGKLDMGILVFFAERSKTYDVAKLEERGQAKVGSSVFVTGYVNDSDDLAKGYRFLKADIISMADQPTLEGYQMAYAGNDSTRLGMSGGPILLSSGQVVGIHGRRERDENSKASNTSLGIPVRLYLSAGVHSNLQGNLARSTGGSPEIHSTDAASSQAASAPALAVAPVERPAQSTPAAVGTPNQAKRNCELLSYQGKDISPMECIFSLRINEDGTSVYDVTWADGDRSTYVFWSDSSVKIYPSKSSGAYSEYSGTVTIKLEDSFRIRIPNFSPVVNVYPSSISSTTETGSGSPAAAAVAPLASPGSGSAETVPSPRARVTVSPERLVPSSGAVGSSPSPLQPGPDQPSADTLIAQEVEIPRRPSLPPPPPTTTVSTVVRLGDTLLKIAQRYGLTMGELLQLNPGLETARLVVGSPVQVVRSAPGRQVQAHKRFDRNLDELLQEACRTGAIRGRECGVSDGSVGFRSGSTSVASQAKKPQVSALPQSSLTGPCAYYLDDWKGNTIGWIGLADENKLLMNIDGNVRAIPVNSRSAEQLLAHDAMYYIEIRMPSWKKTGVELSSKANLKIANTSSETNLIVRATQLCSAD